MELNQCYICFEDCNKKSTCDCNVFLHNECLKKYIEKSNNLNCSICKKEYKNIIKSTKKKYKVSNIGKFFFIFNISGIILIGSGSLILYFYFITDIIYLLILIFPYMLVGIFIIVYAFIFWYKNNLQSLIISIEDIKIKFIDEV